MNSFNYLLRRYLGFVNLSETFFYSSGSDLEKQLARDRESINKFEIARTVLTRLNEAGETALRERREVLKRVVEFEDFTTCWEDDRLEAEGLVARIRQVVNKKDSFTRMSQERDAEARKHRESERIKTEELRQQQENLESVRQDFSRLFTMDDNPQQRGRLLEKVLKRRADNRRRGGVSGGCARGAERRSERSG